MNEIAKIWQERLKHRVARLHRLVGLEAPAFIIAREIIMVQEALKLCSPEAWYQALRYTEMHELKFKAGFCVENDCDCHRERDHAEFPELCSEHIKRLEANIEEAGFSKITPDEDGLS